VIVRLPVRPTRYYDALGDRERTGKKIDCP
jgi:hypothetical protein